MKQGHFIIHTGHPLTSSMTLPEPTPMKFIKSLETIKEQLQAVKLYSFAIKYIINPSEQVQLKAVKENGLSIVYIHNPSKQVQFQAIKEDASAIKYIHNPSPKLQNLYLGYCLKSDRNIYQKLVKNINPAYTHKLPNFIKSPKSLEEELRTVKNDSYAIEYILNPSEQVQLIAVKKYGTAIQYIHNPSEQVQLEAVKQCGTAIEYIHNPTIEYQNLYLSYCLKNNLDVHQKYVKDLDPIHIQNLIDCKELIE